MPSVAKWVSAGWMLAVVGCQSAPPPEPDCSAPDADPVACSQGPMCGGIAGRLCPGAGSCYDNPNDTCDIRTGGADCGGFCRCDVIADCKLGYEFDSSPDVCACVAVSGASCAAVTCLEGTVCEVVDGNPSCVPSPGPCATVRCASGYVCREVDGGANCLPLRDPCAGFDCEPGYHCVAPNDVPRCIAAKGEACGDATCAEGTVCCNASCGICVEPGGGCIQMMCD